MTFRTFNRRNNLRHPGRSPAFTLVELMLVMTVLAVVILAAVPSLASFFRGRSLDSEARRLLALTRHGQSRAVSEGVPMVLWIDVKGRSYGLEEESGYTDVDGKAQEYSVDKELELEVVETPVVAAQAGLMGSFTQSANRRRNLPAIRFQPDGSFGETSLPAICLSEAQGASLWLVQSENRLNYEIQSQTNDWREIRR